ncbi:FemAB family XrtA/PEP-CTERM system-associated protein [Ferrovum sp.]|uniref:FemAB family XrtA/PEP-CTERM system-associated protein n=1 Tax=Ferrovum sp. TaxID=2609467 RepID=UPI00262EF02B|nr:FemAB family XrtA/PEP-CTERM system-associated protein [Ferrovum sp.]
MAELTLRAMTASDEGTWDAFVTACPQATFFHRSGWKRIIEEAFGHRTHFLLAENAQGIQGILPLAEIRHFYFGHSLSSLPFGVYGGIAALSAEATQALDQAAQDLAATLKVDHLEYRQMHSLHPDWPRKELYVTFRREIDPDPEQNMKNIPRKQRAMVRSGIKNGLVSEIDDTVERFYAVFSDNMLRHGTPTFAKRYFSLLKSTFGQDCEVLSVLKDQEVVSSVLTFYFRDEVLPYYAGDTLAARTLAANDFKYWELMRRSCERGYRLFDYGRSKLGTGSYHFKKNWGFEPTPLHYEYRLYRSTEVPDQNPLNPKYQFFIKAWRQLPLPVANWLGPQLVKYLG